MEKSNNPLKIKDDFDSLIKGYLNEVDHKVNVLCENVSELNDFKDLPDSYNHKKEQLEIIANSIEISPRGAITGKEEFILYSGGKSHENVIYIQDKLYQLKENFKFKKFNKKKIDYLIGEIISFGEEFIGILPRITRKKIGDTLAE